MLAHTPENYVRNDNFLDSVHSQIKGLTASFSCSKIQTPNLTSVGVQINALASSFIYARRDNLSFSDTILVRDRHKNECDCSIIPFDRHIGIYDDHQSTELHRSTRTRSLSNSGSDNSDSSSGLPLSEGQLSPPKPPDGGFGWIVVFAAFMVHMITDGVIVSFGVILPDLVQEFEGSTSATSWIGSFAYGVPAIAAPVASVFINNFGCRLTCVLGGIISTLGCVLSFFANSIISLTLAYGFLSGIGCSLCITAAMVIVAEYFEDRRATATGLSIAGTGVGAFIFAPLVEVLLNRYGWRGTILIMAGAFFNIVACGCLMRPVETPLDRRHRQRLVWLQHLAKEAGLPSVEDNPIYLDLDVLGRIEMLRDHLLAPRKVVKFEGIPDDNISFESRKLTNTTCNISVPLHGKTELDNGYTLNIFEPFEYELFKTERSKLYVNCGAEYIQNWNVHTNELASKRRGILVYTPFTLNIPSQMHHTSLKTFPSYFQFLNTPFNKCTPVYNCNGFIKPFSSSFPIDSHREMDLSEKIFSSLHPMFDSMLPVLTASRTGMSNDDKLRAKQTNVLNRIQPSHHLEQQPYNQNRIFSRMLRCRAYRLRHLPYRVTISLPDLNRARSFQYGSNSSESSSSNGSGCLGESKNKCMHAMCRCSAFNRYQFGGLTFTCFIISNFVLFFWYNVTYFFINDHAIHLGMAETSAVLLLSILGLANMFGEVAIGILGDQDWVDGLTLYVIMLFVCGISTVIASILYTFSGLSIYSAIFGFCLASNDALCTILLVEFVGLNNLTNALGICLFCQGVANLLGPPVIGWIVDVNNSYRSAFIISGLGMVLAALVVVPVLVRRWIRYYLRRNRRKRQYDSLPMCPMLKVNQDEDGGGGGNEYV